MPEQYREDLAYIHDAGYRDYAIQSASNILKILHQHGITTGQLIDLGCGSGLSAEIFTQAGFQVLGIDISEAMIALAQQRVPAAEFQVASLFQAALPPCQVVTAIGECLNYLFDPQADRQSLYPLFKRIYQALEPRGLFLCDIVEAGQVPSGEKVRSFTEGDDWVVLVEKKEDPKQEILTRRIITFRQVGAFYRRDEEVHQQYLLQASELVAQLQQIGFQVETSPCYGDFQLPVARVALIARKGPSAI